MADAAPFGRYELVKRLALGGMAEIWLARQAGPAGFQKMLVLKRILPHLVEDEQFVKMFLDEARLAAQLSHPNIAQVTDFGEVDGTYYIAMELVRGPDLRRLLRACKKASMEVPAPVAARIMAQACAALAYAHRAADSEGQPLSVIHRDVSPQNILVSLDGNAKLVDFGIAKAATQSHHTEAGTVKGKFAYLAPEQLRGKGVEPRTDIYAAGLVFYELLTGEAAIQGEGQAAMMAVLESKVRPIAELRPEVPASLAAVVERAMAREPSDRWPDAGAMEAAIEKYLARAGDPVTSREVAEFLRSVRLDSGDPLSVAGTGSFHSKPPSVEAPPRQPSDPFARKLARPPPMPPPRPPEESIANQSTVIGMQAVEEETEPDGGPTRIKRAPARVEPSTQERGSAPRRAERESAEQSTEERGSAPRRAERESAEQSTVQIDAEAAGLRPRRRRSPAGPIVFALVLLAVAGGAVYWKLRPPAPEPSLPPPVAAAPAPPRAPQAAAVQAPAPAPDPVAAAAPEPAAPPPAPDPTTAPVAEREPENAPAERRASPNPTHGRREKRAREAPEAAAAPAPAPAAPGLLTLMSSPGAEVTVDGKPFGSTPVVKKPLPAGRHEVVLANNALFISKRLEVDIAPGEDHKEAVRLGRAKVTFLVLPWGEIKLGGRTLGQTPLPPQSLYEGTYDVSAANPDTGRTQHVKLVVAAGVDQVVRVDLR